MPVLGAMIRITLAMDTAVATAQVLHWPLNHSVSCSSTKLQRATEKSHRPFSNPSFLFLFLCKDFLSKPSLNPSEIELGSEVTLKDFPYVNYSQPRSGVEVGAPTICRWGRPQATVQIPIICRCRFGLIKSYTEPVYLSLWRILGNFLTFLPSLEL